MNERTSLFSPVYQDEFVTAYHGDAMVIMPALEDEVDLVLADPPYGETSLAWDFRVKDWPSLAPGRSLWCFGSFRSLAGTLREFADGDWTYSQEIVWEKHNGSSFHADRFRRVHELAAHFYRGPWASLYKDVPKTLDATKRTVRRKGRPPHTGHIEASAYASEDGGPRMMRSVIQCRSAHGSAVHPTQKPEGIVRPLIEYACPPGGLVLDPFAGSGTTGIAARQLGRRAILIERNENYVEAMVRRLGQMELVA
jgi:site-specific DNA-methyltransferase (adenine-specific)